MARQVLTFFIVFAGLMLLFRGCNKPESAPPAVVTEVLATIEDSSSFLQVEHAASGVIATFDVDGTLVSISDKSGSILRAVNGGRRAFHLLEEVRGTGWQFYARDGWAAEKTVDGAVFTHTRGDRIVRKTVRVTANGVDCDLKIENANEKAKGFLLTALGGVPLQRDDRGGKTGTIQRVKGGRAIVRGWASLVQAQERARGEYQKAVREESPGAQSNYEKRLSLRADQTVERIGVLGASHLFTMENLPSVSSVSTVAYHLKRDAGRTREIETWVGLPAISRGYEGTFSIRWAERKDAMSVDDALEPLAVTRNAKETILDNDSIRLALTDEGAAISWMQLKKFVQVAGEGDDPKNWVEIIGDYARPGQRALTLMLKDTDRFGVDPGQATWEISNQSASSVTFRLESAGGWIFEKTISLPDGEDRYDLSVDILVTKPDGAPDENFKYVLVGPAAAYISDTKRGVMFSSGAVGFLLERDGGENDTIEQREIEDNETLEHNYGGDTTHLAKGIGVRSAYFMCALSIPDKSSDGASRIVRTELRALRLEQDVPYMKEGETYRTSIQGRVHARIPFPSNRSAFARYTLYAGPADIDRLRPLGLEESVDFGMFSSIGRFLMWLMKSLQGLFGSYGLAIIFMTLLVRAALLPVSYKSQLSVQRYSKRMTKMKPLLEALEKKFGKNRQKLNQERMKLMKEQKVGFPLGCLMMFVQIPIWIALFGALRVEFALRHESFLWASDLSLPDGLMSLPFWPHSFNLLPILMLVLWTLQQKLNPQAQSEDPQVRAQMKMVKFMPYIFFFMLYTYASALSVYMCVSSAWGIMEAKFVKKAIARLDGP